MPYISLEDAKCKLKSWKEDYNKNRPHSSLGNQTPEEFAKAQKQGVFGAPEKTVKMA